MTLFAGCNILPLGLRQQQHFHAVNKHTIYGIQNVDLIINNVLNNYSTCIIH